MITGLRKRCPMNVWAGLALGLVVFGLASCVPDGESAPKRPLAFPHKRHVVDEEMECSACHRDATKEAHAGMPTLATCDKCHESIDAKKPPEKQVKAFLVDGKPEWSHVTTIPDDVKFAHKTHLAANIQCETCHKGIRDSKEITTRLRVEMKDCQSCHAKQSVGQAQDNCAVCHTAIGKQWKPASHERDWMQLHGRVAASQSKLTAETCSNCHTQATCTNCHRNEQPKSHTNYWRERGHGQTATLDRNVCKACHTEDSCVRCHRETAPLSHKGNWDGNHCANCHLPVSGESCNACHKDTRSHNQAPQLPATPVHQTATPNTCRNCHTPTHMMTHFDNGQNCLLCHHR